MAITEITLGHPSGNKIFQDTNIANTKVGVASSSVTLHFIELDNTANAGEDNYLKLYNLASGSVTVGTTVPDWVLEVRQGAKLSLPILGGHVFNTALTIACVTAGGDGGTTSPGSAVIVRIVYA